MATITVGAMKRKLEMKSKNCEVVEKLKNAKEQYGGLAKFRTLVKFEGLKDLDTQELKNCADLLLSISKWKEDLQSYNNLIHQVRKDDRKFAVKKARVSMYMLLDKDDDNTASASDTSASNASASTSNASATNTVDKPSAMVTDD